MQAAINITPLVDVVLVLLIIFMVMVPQMQKAPELELPDTQKPGEQGGDEKGRIMVSIDDAGALWIDDKQVAPEQFSERLQAAAAAVEKPRIVLRGASNLNFRDVRQTMIAIEEAGFQGVGLAAKRTTTVAQKD
jgi:biopolymer transport protein ExbD/biopolymer transport protein TolR